MKSLDTEISVPLNKQAINDIPITNGVYFFRHGKEILYIGKSINLKARLLSHIENARLDSKEAAIINNSDTVSYVITDSEFKALLLESELIKRHKPKYNSRWRDDKSYLYIKISVKDTYPKIMPVRREFDKKSKYFGPFPSIRSIEEVLKQIRKVFPYCTQRKITKRPCFYAKINLCNPCPNVIEHTQNENEKKRLQKIYKYNIRQIVRILEGHADKVLNNLYKELKRLSEEEKYEEALILRNKIYRFEHLINGRLINSDIDSSFNQSEESTMSLVTLLKRFFPQLQHIKRIECYDISNNSMKDATASMVVFTEGLADKREYRRFKIKNEALESDFEMMEEVFRRRLRRDWEKPDLIVVDGGKPQVRRVSEVLRNLSVNIPMIGIAKHPDRLVINNSDLPMVKPPPHHLGFNMIRAMRDESHRFAKKYHLYLRDKKFLIQ